MEWEPLEILLDLMTRARAKRFEEVLNFLIQDVQVEGAHVFNSKEETKMVHVIKVNPNLDQDPDIFDLLIYCYFRVDLLLIWC